MLLAPWDAALLLYAKLYAGTTSQIYPNQKPHEATSSKCRWQLRSKPLDAQSSFERHYRGFSRYRNSEEAAPIAHLDFRCLV